VKIDSLGWTAVRMSLSIHLRTGNANRGSARPLHRRLTLKAKGAAREWWSGAMERGVIGLVTAEATVRVWTRRGAFDLAVAEPDRLRGLLGARRVDREPMLPGGLWAEMVLFDGEARSLTVSAPYQPEDGRFFPLVPPFAVQPARTAPAWSESTFELLTSWIASRIDAAGLHGEILHIRESNTAEQGRRQVSCYFVDDGEEWCAAIQTNAPTDQVPIWSQAGVRDETASIRFPMEANSAESLAMLALMTVAEWPGGPHDLVLGWSPARTGPRPRELDPEPPRTRSGTTPRVRDGRGNQIDVLYVPHDGDEALRLVTIDRRDATRWYRYLNGGPAEGVLLVMPGIHDHELYVNGRYADLDPAAVNDRATAILEHFGVGMYLGHVRGDALLMRAVGGGNYPKPIEQALVDLLCG